VRKCKGIALTSKILTSNLEYKTAESLRVGGKLIGFENNKYKTTKVTKLDRVRARIYQVTLNNGDKLKVSKECLWLAKHRSCYEWTATDNIKNKTLMPIFPVWERLHTYEAGYIASFLDSEGWLSYHRNHGGVVVGIAQRPGPVLDYVKEQLHSFGFNWYEHEADCGCMSVSVPILGI